MQTVYVAGPLTNGGRLDIQEQRLNIRRACSAADTLMMRGFAPFVPHLSWHQNEMFPRDRELWMRVCLELVGVHNILLRLPGDSEGADQEVGKAQRLSIPVYYSIGELIRHEGESYLPQV